MIAYILIITGFLLRLVPHVPNTAPIAAIALFGGAVLNKKAAPWVPLAIMMVTDILLGLHDVVLYTWGAFIVIGFLGTRMKERRTALGIFGYTLVSAVFFFAVTNFGVFLTWYPHTARGFVDCYIKALPFLRNSLAGNMVFSFALFGIYEIAGRMIKDTRYSEVLLAD